VIIGSYDIIEPTAVGLASEAALHVGDPYSGAFAVGFGCPGMHGGYRRLFDFPFPGVTGTGC
jgi:hypothetical protein